MSEIRNSFARYLISFGELIVLLGLAQVYKLWKNRDELKVYYEVPLKERVQFAILYFGLVGSLGMGISYTLEVLR